MLYRSKSLWGGLISNLLVYAWLGVLSIQAAPFVIAQEAGNISASEVYSLTNNMRQAAGLSSLANSGQLARSAQLKASDMAAKSYFAHANPEGQRLAYWLGLVGYDYKFAGENLAVGYETAAGAMTGWKNSPTHYANIVKPEYTELGIGVAAGIYQNEPVIFVVQHFGLTKAAVVVPDPVVAETAPVAKPEPVVVDQPAVEQPVSVVNSVPIEEPVFMSTFNLIPSAYAAVDQIENNLEEQVVDTNADREANAILSVLVLLMMIVAFELYVEIESHKAWWAAVLQKWTTQLA